MSYVQLVRRHHGALVKELIVLHHHIPGGLGLHLERAFYGFQSRLKAAVELDRREDARHNAQEDDHLHHDDKDGGDLVRGVGRKGNTADQYEYDQ